MKLLFKQRFFSWFDSYDIYDEYGQVAFVVKGKMAWGHLLEVYDAAGNHVATLEEKIFSFLPRFEIYLGGQYYGQIKKEFTLLRPVYSLEYNGWQVHGDMLGWDYNVTDTSGQQIMQASKELFNWTDTYTISIVQPQDALISLMIVLAIDAANCSRTGGN